MSTFQSISPTVGSVFAWSKSLRLFSLPTGPASLPMLFGFTDEAHKPHDNKQAENEPRTDVWCLAHNESRGWDEREQGRWDSGSSIEWTGLAVVSLRGICMFKQPRNLVMFSARGGLEHF